jgi:exopolyphosphatase/guanosine-5'-triphosphate,3'-diphosphate pyrophosphatase
MRIAGIDIGTLTCRLLIADVNSEGKVVPLQSDRKILRLGEGVDQAKQLKSEAMIRVMQTIREWHKEIEGHTVEAFTAVATSAVREAKNREEFLSLIKNEAGVDVEVIDGAEEARRTLLGIKSGLSERIDDLLALDIGGGSTEFILSRKGQAPKCISMDMGVVRVTERFFHSDPPTAYEIHDAHDMIVSLTKKALSNIGEVNDVTFIGTAGTITTLSAMAQGLTTYDPTKVHNYVLHLSTIRSMEEDLFRRTKAERGGIPGLEPGREDRKSVV